VRLKNQYISKKLYNSKIHTWKWTARNGYLEIVKWLHENNKPGCTTDVMDLAAMHGHLEVVKWLHENRNEGCTTWAIDLAASMGNLKVVEWLHENRSEGCTAWAIDWEIDAMGGTEVIKPGNGHLEVVKWLHKNKSQLFPMFQSG